MTEESKKQAHDAALGMNREISRRDFMNSTLLASGDALLSGLTPHQLLAQLGKEGFTGYGGTGDYAESNGNTFQVMAAGHQIRDHLFANPPQAAEDTGEIFDFAIVGGGLSGLATALYLQQKAPQAKSLVREQLTEMFAASGFDAQRDIAGIVLNRWGHAYCSPQPGFFFGQNGKPAMREILRRAPFGRIAFANTDLSGDPGHATAIEEGQRAASQLLDRIY